MEILEIKGDKKPAMTCTVALSDGTTVSETTGCNEKEEGYVAKIKSWEAAKYTKEKERLEGMAHKGKMKPELMAWLERRLHILKQFIPSDGGEEEEL